MITPNPDVKHYTEISPIGKPILDIFDIDYQDSCIETIQVMQYYEDWNFNLLTAMKYLWRLGQKSPEIKADLIKAIDYLQWALADELNYLPMSVKKYQVQEAIKKCKELINDEK
jgi:Protein of unknwon function (DUF3310)